MGGRICRKALEQKACSSNRGFAMVASVVLLSLYFVRGQEIRPWEAEVKGLRLSR
jgi:hypothetical protein